MLRQVSRCWHSRCSFRSRDAARRRGLTRHLPPASPGKAWKTSLVFTVRNAPGELFRSVSAFGLRDLNLTKIESRPLRGKPWEYLFYLDFLGREDDPRVKNALGHLGKMADFLRVLGSYPKGD